MSILLQDKLDRLEEKLRSLMAAKEAFESGVVIAPEMTRRLSESEASTGQLEPPERAIKWYEAEQLNRSDRDYL